MAFSLLFIFCLAQEELRNQLFALAFKIKQLAILAFLGIFCLYFFETWAFAKASIPLVSFLIYAAGAVTIMLSAIFLKERISFLKIMSFALLVIGIILICLSEGRLEGSILGIILALIAGAGYALFIFFSKKLDIGSGVPHLVWLFGFGSIFLAFPLLQTEQILLPASSLWSILLLVLIPTIGGFWFTLKAIDDGSASGVQIIETSDPLFASLYAFILFSEILHWQGWVGAGFIMAGLIAAILAERFMSSLEN